MVLILGFSSKTNTLLSIDSRAPQTYIVDFAELIINTFILLWFDKVFRTLIVIDWKKTPDISLIFLTQKTKSSQKQWIVNWLS